MKRLFDENGECYTDLANELETELIEALRPVFEQWRHNFPLREIHYIACAAAKDIELSMLMDKQRDAG